MSASKLSLDFRDIDESIQFHLAIVEERYWAGRRSRSLEDMRNFWNHPQARVKLARLFSKHFLRTK